MNSEAYAAFLLHGVTGSGKTEIYMRAMNKALKSRSLGDDAGAGDRADAGLLASACALTLAIRLRSFIRRFRKASDLTSGRG